MIGPINFAFVLFLITITTLSISPWMDLVLEAPSESNPLFFLSKQSIMLHKHDHGSTFSHVS